MQRNHQQHNLCDPSIVLPPGTKSLLGLGFKFGIEHPRPYQDLCTALNGFRRSVDLRMYLVSKDLNDEPNMEFNNRLYVKSGFLPPTCNNPHYTAMNKFHNMVNNLRKNLSTFRRFNLRPLARRGFKALKAMGLFIVMHNTDKGLGSREKEMHHEWTKLFHVWTNFLHDSYYLALCIWLFLFVHCRNWIHSTG